MKNLGKILALVSFLFPHAVYAGVTAGLDAKSVSLGETVTLSLTISGQDIIKPDIFVLCDTDVISTSEQTSVQIINRAYTKSTVLNYRFLPKKSCEIQAISVEVDGKMEITQPMSLEVKPASATQDAHFMLTLESDKKDVYVGEPFELTLLFKQRRDAEAVDSNFIAPDLKGFWIKNESKPERYQEGDYTVTKLIYTMAAQREGILEITPAQMKIASRSNTRDSWGTWMPQVKWRSYFSNDLKIIVKPLPGAVSLIGDFTITATADKLEINPNEAVNITVEIRGEGNLEDIKTLKPSVNGVSVFDEKILIQGSKLSQKMAFVADANFTVPAFTLKFFNPKTQKIESVESQEIAIKVKGTQAKQELTVKRQEEISLESPKNTDTTTSSEGGISPFWIVVVFMVGLACGILLMLWKPWTRISGKKSVSVKDPRVLLITLLAYKEDSDVAKIIEILENKLYSQGTIEIDKKILKSVFEKYNIK